MYGITFKRMCLYEFTLYERVFFLFFSISHISVLPFLPSFFSWSFKKPYQWRIQKIWKPFLPRVPCAFYSSKCIGNRISLSSEHNSTINHLNFLLLSKLLYFLFFVQKAKVKNVRKKQHQQQNNIVFGVLFLFFFIRELNL